MKKMKRLVSLLLFALLIVLPFYAWAEDTYTVTFLPGAHGTGEGKPVSLPFGLFEDVPTTVEELAAYGIVPEAGYMFHCWLVNDSMDEQWEYYPEEEGPYFVESDATFTADWIAEGTPKYTLYVDVNGSPESKDPTSVYEGKNFFLPPKVVAPEGMAFAGWDVYAADAEGKPTGSKLYTALPAYSTITATQSMVAVATWENANQEKYLYTLTFRKDGSPEAETISPAPTTYEGYYILPECPFTNGDQTFTGWRRNGQLNQPGTSYYVNDHMQFTAVWESGSSEMCTVTFLPNCDNRTDATERGMPAGSEFTLDAAFTREDYNLIGWSTDPNGGADYAFGAKVKFFENTTLYAVWQPKNVTLTLKKNNGTEEGQDNTQEYGSVFSLALPQGFTYTDHAFAGWAESATGPVEYTAEDTITLTENKTLYARWKSTKATLTLYKNDGTSAATESTQLAGDNFQLQALYTRDGYTLKGWSTSADGPVEYAVTATIKLDVDMTLYAVWEKNPETYTVTFDANGGSGSMAAQTFTEGQAQALTPNAFTRDGFVFAGWNTKADGSGDTYTDNVNVTMSSSLTLYAVWVEQYTIRFEFPPVGTFTDAQKFASVTVNAGSMFTLPTIDGYEVHEAQTFKAWNVLNESQQSLHNEKDAGFSFEVTCNTVIIPVLESKVFTLKYKANLSDATALDTVTGIRYGTEYEPKAVTEFPAIVNPDSENYEFNCWTVYDDDTGKIVGEAFVNSEYTFHVEWNCTLVPNWVHKTETYQLTIVYTDDEIFDDAKQPGPTPKGANYELPPAHLIEHKDGLELDYWLVTMGGQTYNVEPLGILPATDNATARAVWKGEEEPVIYTITFAGNGGSGSMQTLTVEKGNVFYFPENGFTAPVGHLFEGWMVDNGLQVLSRVGDPFTPDRNLTVNAVWKPKKITISYDSNGSEDSFEGEVFDYDGKPYELRGCDQWEPPAGMTFEGWLIEGETELRQPGYQFIPTDDVKVIAQWRPVVCTISFSAGEGTGTMQAVTVDYGTAYTLPQCTFTAPAGKEFDTWGVGDELLHPGDPITVTDNVVVTANWIRSEFNVSLVPDNGGLNEAITDTVKNGGSYTLPACSFTAPENKKFGGWHYNFENMVQDPGDTFVDIHWDCVFTAVWVDLDSLAVTFDAAGGSGSMNALSVKENTPFELPECGFTAPTGKQFKAWDVNGVEYKPGENVTVSSATTVKAVWDTAILTITLRANNSTGEEKTETIAYGESYTLPECPFAAETNKVFDMWRINGVGASAGESFVVHENMTIDADWANSEYTVTLNANNGTDEKKIEIVKFRDSFTLPGNSFTDADGDAFSFTAPYGMMFSHWQLVVTTPDASWTEDCEVGDVFTTVKANLTFNAVWTEKGKHAVTFDANGGSGSMETEYIYDGETYVLPDCEFGAPEGKEFACWNVGGAEYEPGDEITVNGKQTVTAIWTAATIYVNFDGGDCGSGTMPTEEAKYGVAYTLPGCGFSYNSDDYVFTGWLVNGKAYNAYDTVVLKADTTITATWADRWYSLTFKDSNASADDKRVTVQYGESYTLGDPASYGFTPKNERLHMFEQWTRDNDDAYAAGSTITGIRRNMTFVANWKFAEIVEIEDEATGETVKIENAVTTDPAPINPDDAKVMNATDPDDIPDKQLGDMLRAMQENTADANEAAGEVKIETVQDIVDALQEAINDSESGETEETQYPEENIVLQDIIPIIEIKENGVVVETIKVTDKETMKSLVPDNRGIRVAIELPANTNPMLQEFKITHMLSQDAWDGSGKQAGSIEVLDMDGYDTENVYVRMKNFSPVAIAWKDKPAEVIIPSGVIDDLPETGDPSSLMAWVTLLGASGLGMKAIKRRKK